MTRLSTFSSSLLAMRLIVLTDFNKVIIVCGFDCYSSIRYPSFHDGDLCYVFFEKKMNIAAAQRYCLDLGFHLPRVTTIQSFSDAIRARNFASQTGNATVWLGIQYQRTHGQHLWGENNELVNFASLDAEGLANEDVDLCKVIDLSNLRISNVNCTKSLHVLCVKSQLHWFGPNKMHLCHCRSGGCDERGTCHEADGRCAIGWFGEGCQYGDILINTPNNLTDFDDTTCMSIANQVKFYFQNPHYVIWIRVVSKHPVSRDLFSVEVDTSNGTLACLRGKVFIINNCTVDFLCNGDLILAQAVFLILTRPNTLCSVHIFRGQNVGLKQKASLSSTQDSCKASNAVDGEYGTITPSAMATEEDTEQTWTLELERKAIIFEVLAYLKYPVYDSMLGVNFTLEIITRPTLPFIYLPFTFDGKRSFVSILSTTTEAAESVIIRMNKTEADRKALDLSEVLVFGACAPPFYGPYCTSVCSTSCVLQLCHVNGECLTPETVLTTLKTTTASTTMITTTASTTMITTTATTTMITTTASTTMKTTTFPSTIQTTPAPLTIQTAAPITTKAVMTTSKRTKMTSSDITTRKSQTAHTKENRTFTTATMATSTLQTEVTNTNAVITTPTKMTTIKRIESDCPEGYSGRKCMYLCLCKNRLCDKWGRCRDGSSCANGWFALQCQYKNLAFNGQTSDPVLNDGDDSTCVIPQENVATAEVDEPFLFTWIRIVFGPEAQVLNLSLNFHQPETCLNIRVVSEVRNQFDVFCHNEVVTRRIELRWQGAGPVCSLYINGGRNVAFEGHFHMSDDTEKYDLHFLKDGNITNLQSVDLNADLNNNLTLKFSNKMTVYRIELFTDASNGTDTSFSLNGTLQDGTVLFQYISTSGERHLVFSSETLGWSLQDITFLSVEGSLNISEVLVFGDCAPPLFFIGCTEICILTCSRNRCNYNGFCYECPLGSRGDHCMEVFGETDDKSTPIYNIPKKKRNKKKENHINYFILFIPFIGILLTVCYKLRDGNSQHKDISKTSVIDQREYANKIKAEANFDRKSDYFVSEGSSVDLESQYTSEYSKYSIGIHPGGAKQNFSDRRNGTKMKEMKEIPSNKRLLNKSSYLFPDSSSVDTGTPYTVESSSYSLETQSETENTENTSKLVS